MASCVAQEQAGLAVIKLLICLAGDAQCPHGMGDHVFMVPFLPEHTQIAFCLMLSTCFPLPGGCSRNVQHPQHRAASSSLCWVDGCTLGHGQHALVQVCQQRHCVHGGLLLCWKTRRRTKTLGQFWSWFACWSRAFPLVTEQVQRLQLLGTVFPPAALQLRAGQGREEEFL